MIKDINEGYCNKLKNRLFGLLCEFEKDGEWEPFLDNLLVELMGVPEDQWTIDYLTLYRKLSALRYLRYEYFRKTIFDCMNLLSRGGKNGLL